MTSLSFDTKELPLLTTLVYRVELVDWNFREAVHKGLSELKTFIDKNKLDAQISKQTAGLGVGPIKYIGTESMYYETGYVFIGDAESLIQSGEVGFITDKGGNKREGLFIRKIPSGKWRVAVLYGSYEGLYQAWRSMMDHIKETGLEIDPKRPCYEHYLKDYKLVKEEELETELLVPIL